MVRLSKKMMTKGSDPIKPKSHKHKKSKELKKLLKKSKEKRHSKKDKLLESMKRKQLEDLSSESSDVDDLSDMYDSSDSDSSSDSDDSKQEMDFSKFNPEKSLDDNLVNDKLRMDIMSRDYVNICTQIHLLSKTLSCSKDEKNKIATLVYYYIKYFLYSCCIKKKPIFDWLEEFKDKIHIY